MSSETTTNAAPVDGIVIGHPPEIPHGERRSVSELWPSQICGCGRKVRYITTKGEAKDDACNKYGRCMSWDELKAKYDELREAAQEFADEPMDCDPATNAPLQAIDLGPSIGFAYVFFALCFAFFVWSILSA